MKRADIIAGIIGIFLSAYVYWAAGNFPEDKVLLLGPGFFPRLLAGALAIMSCVLLVKALMGKSMAAKEKFDIKDPGIQRAGIALLATGSYIYTLNYLGFILDSILYLMFLMFLLKLRNYVQMVLVSLSVTVVVFAVFRIFLHITLPLGFFG